MNIIKKIYWRIQWICSIRMFTYLYLNYFCKNVERESDVKIIPYKGAVINMHRTSRLILKNKNLEVGINRLKGSKTETLVRLGQGVVWQCNGGASLTYGTTIDIKRNALIDSGFFFMNVGSAIVCAKKISIGDDVWMGRGVIIYDSDFHRMLDENNEIRNYPKEVCIGNHVWLTNQIMVQKGTHIGDGSVISPFTLVREDIPAHSLNVNGTLNKVVNSDIRWSSELL